MNERVVKEEPKRKIKLSKPKKMLLLLDETEENDNQSNDESIDSCLYNKRHLDLNKMRSNALSSYGLNDCNYAEEDIFDQNKISDNKEVIGENSKTNDELKELIDLIKEVKDKGINTSICQLNDSNDSVLELNESVSENTRSNTRSKKGNKTKKINKKNNKKKNKKSVINEQEMFDKLDVMEFKDGIEILEDIEEIETLNASLIVTEDVEQFMHSRSIEIKVKYRAVIKKFSIKQNEKFLTIMPLIAAHFGEEVSNVILRLNDSIITAESTPQSIGLNISDIIVFHKRVNTSNNGIQMKDPNLLTLTLRDSSKVIETIIVSKFDEISKIMCQYSQKRGVPQNKFRLEFDGERLEANQTVSECDIDDESQIDVINL